MSESLSHGPNIPLFVSDHENCRDNVHAAMSELKIATDSDRIRMAAQQLVEQQMRLADTYEQVAEAYIDAGMIDNWIDDFIHEDERAIWRMFEDVYTDNAPDELGNVYFSQMPRDEMYRLATEHATDITTPQPVHSINGYIAPEFTGKRAIKYEYGFKISSAIDNFTEKLPESTQVIIAQEREIYQFREILNKVDSSFIDQELSDENIDDGQLIVNLLKNSREDPLLSTAISDYEDAKTTFATTLEQISRTSPVRVTVRHGLYRDVRKDVDMLSYHFNLLCDILYEKYDKKLASRMMAAHWRQDKELLNSIINSLSNGTDELPGMIDAGIEAYSDYFMGISTPEDKGFGGNLPSRTEIIGYYTNALEKLVEKVKNLR